MFDKPRHWAASHNMALNIRRNTAKLAEGNWRGAAVVGPDGVYALGSANALSDCLGCPGSARTADLNLIDPTAPPHAQALALEALMRGIARGLPLKPHRTRRGNTLIVVPGSEGERQAVTQARSMLRKAYGEDIVGYLPKEFGVTGSGKPRLFAEAVRLHLDYALDRWWLVFLPVTWKESVIYNYSQSPLTPDPASDWVRERWAKRKRNDNWAQIIDAWERMLTKSQQVSTVWPVPYEMRNLVDTVCAPFELGTKTAWSRRNR